MMTDLAWQFWRIGGDGPRWNAPSQGRYRAWSARNHMTPLSCTMNRMRLSIISWSTRIANEKTTVKLAKTAAPAREHWND